MKEIFLSIVNMSISASWIVLVVLLLRMIFKNAPKWIRVLLWGIVAIRLVCPLSVESFMSLMPSAETIRPEIMMDEKPIIDSGVPVINNVINPVIVETFTPEPTDSVNPLQVVIEALMYVWVIGITVMVLYTIISYRIIAGRVSTAVRLKDNIYQSENVDSPFVLGIISPKIYVSYNVSGDDLEYVIAHERAHICRKDYLWKPLGFIILSVHWFNPLMWLGYVLLCRDIELACDEKVIRELNVKQKADYSQALLACSVNRRMIAACPIAFGEVSVKERVKSVLNYKKPAFWIIAAAIIVCAVVAVCFLTNPKSSLDSELDVFVAEQIEKHYSYPKEGEFSVFDYKVLDVKKAFGKETVYMWVLYHNYSYESDKIRLESAVYIPTAITVKRTGKDRHYELVEYWEPRDGSYYAKDIKKKFPWHLHGKALDSQMYIDEQIAFCENAANDYFSSSSIRGEAVGKVQAFEATVSYANWSDAKEFYSGALNNDKIMTSNSSVRHLPVYRFDTLTDLELFKKSIANVFAMDSGYNEVASFNASTSKYDSSFFEKNSVVLIYVSANNCTHRFTVHNVEYDEKSFAAYIVETTKAETVDTAMAGWFVTIEVPDEIIKNCTDFDAQLNNGTELPGYSEVYNVTPLEELEMKHNNSEMVVQKLHYKADDATWVCGGYTYKYRLEITGKLNGTDKNSTYYVLSNVKNITYDQAWKASGLSSNMRDYFNPEDAIVVGYRVFSLTNAKEDLDAQITSVLNQKYQSEKPDGLIHIENYHLFASETASGTPLVNSTDHIEMVTYYMLVYHMKYSVKGENVEATDGGYEPTVITFMVSENGKYTLKEYWVPKNGVDYEKETRNKFPNEYVNEVLNIEKYAQNLKIENERQAKEVLKTINNTY